MATHWRCWTPEEAARREAEYVRLIAAADAATRRMALRLEAVRSANRHRMHQPVDDAARPSQAAEPDGDADPGPRRRRRKSEDKREKDAEKLERKWQQRRTCTGTIKRGRRRHGHRPLWGHAAP